MQINTKYYYRIYFLILIKILNFLPLRIRKISFINKLIRSRSSISPYIYNDLDFLSYVYKKSEGLKHNSNSITTLALRASTTDYAFYSPVWKNSYNLGLTSSDLFNAYHLYKNLRTTLPKLKNVIVFFSVSAPGFSLIHSLERYRTVAYKYFFDVPYSTKDYIDPKFEKSIFKICENLNKPEIDLTYSGYDKKSYFGTDIATQERVRTHLRENRREPSQMNWLKSLINLVNTDGHRMILIIPPFRSDFKNLLPRGNLLFEKLFKLESEGIEILDFYNSEIFVDTDFGDTDHLNEIGAIKMTNELLKIFEDSKWN